MAATAPVIEFEGHTYVMVPQETGRLVQPGNAHMLSRREVEAVVSKLERYERTNHPQFEKKHKAKLAAYRELLSGGTRPAKKEG